MDKELLDRLTIKQLVDNWVVWRDAGDWDRFRTVWFDDGVMQATWTQGTADEFIAMSKADIVREGVRLGVDFSRTVSCYQADAEGRACGRCDACRLRAEGFRAAGVPDSTRYLAR